MNFRNSLVAAAMTLAAGLGNVQAEDKWYPSKWGADDQLGSFNMNGPERTLEAAKLIKTGKTYRLGIETSAKGFTSQGNHFQCPNYSPRILRVDGGRSKRVFHPKLLDQSIWTLGYPAGFQ